MRRGTLRHIAFRGGLQKRAWRRSLLPVLALTKSDHVNSQQHVHVWESFHID